VWKFCGNSASLPHFALLIRGTAGSVGLARDVSGRDSCRTLRPESVLIAEEVAWRVLKPAFPPKVTSAKLAFSVKIVRSKRVRLSRALYRAEGADAGDGFIAEHARHRRPEVLAPELRPNGRRRARAWVGRPRESGVRGTWRGCPSLCVPVPVRGNQKSRSMRPAENSRGRRSSAA
jgi:hypothetical protein